MAKLISFYPSEVILSTLTNLKCRTRLAKSYFDYVKNFKNNYLNSPFLSVFFELIINDKAT